MTGNDAARLGRARPSEPGKALRGACAPDRSGPLEANRFGEPRTGFRCACCGREVVTSVGGVASSPAAGSPRRFCSPACRQAALRRRRAGVPEDTLLQPAGGATRSLARTRTEAGQ